MEYAGNLPTGYNYVFAIGPANNEGATTIWCNIASAAEWRSWLEVFETDTNQKFVVKRMYNELVR